MNENNTLRTIYPDKRNANRGTAKGQKMIVRSIQEDGFGRSALLDKNNQIIAGNKTTEAAAEVFGVDIEPIIVETDGKRPVYVKRTDLDLDDPHGAARRLAYRDNLSSHFSFDLDPAQVMADIEAGFDFEAIDVGLADLGEMLGKAADELLNGNNAGADTEPQVDKAEELQEKWQVKPGDIWECAGHFVICGDCREPETWEQLLAAAKVDKVNGVFTSPPYAEQRKAQYGGVPTAEYVEWWGAVQSNVRANLAADGSFFVNIKPHCEDGERVLYVFDLVLAMKRRWGWRYVDELSWVNGGYPGNFSPRFKNGFEPVYHFSIGDIKHRPDSVKFEMTDANKRKTVKNQETYGPGRHYSPTGSNTNRNDFTFSTESALPSNVIQIPADRGFLRDDIIIGIHSATFPVALPTFFIKAYSDPGDVWLDPFLGSGTTAIAAHNEGRRGLGIERLEKYVAVILERLSSHTGKTPVLLSGVEHNKNDE